MVRFRRNFLWERYGEKKKINLMRWSEVIKPKRIGILVILKIRTGLYWQNNGRDLGRKRKLIVSKFEKDKWGWVPKSVLRYRVLSLGLCCKWDECNTIGRSFQKGWGFIVGERRCQILF